MKESIRLFCFVCFGKVIVKIRSMSHRIKSKDHIETPNKVVRKNFSFCVCFNT